MTAVSGACSAPLRRTRTASSASAGSDPCAYWPAAWPPPTAAQPSWQAAHAGLAANPHDLPFSLTYLFEDDGSARLAFTTGFAAGSRRRAPIIGIAPHPACGHSTSPRRWSTCPGFATYPPGPGTAHRPRRWSCRSLAKAARHPIGAMVVGLNPHRQFDADYLGFLKLLAGQISSSLASADAYEAEHRRAAALAEALGMRQQAAKALEEVNARLASEVEIRTAERDRLRTLFQRAPGFMCVLQGPDLVFEFMNEAYQQLVGHRDLTGLPVRKALPEIEGQGFFEILDEVYQDRRAFRRPQHAGRHPAGARRAT